MTRVTIDRKEFDIEVNLHNRRNLTHFSIKIRKCPSAGSNELVYITLASENICILMYQLVPSKADKSTVMILLGLRKACSELIHQ